MLPHHWISQVLLHHCGYHLGSQLDLQNKPSELIKSYGANKHHTWWLGAPRKGLLCGKALGFLHNGLSFQFWTFLWRSLTSLKEYLNICTLHQHQHMEGASPRHPILEADAPIVTLKQNYLWNRINVFQRHKSYFEITGLFQRTRCPKFRFQPRD